MPRQTRIALLVVLISACGPGGRADRSSEPAIDRFLADYQGTDRPGACLLIRHRGAVVYRRCGGMADLEAGVATSPATNFRLASVTKELTATAVLRLVERGRLSLATTLDEALPGFPPWAKRITIERLLSHTSGLIDYESLMPEGDSAQIHDDGVVRLLQAQDSTYFPPGAQFKYSNSAYAVLAQIVERTSGTTFTDFLHAEIFEPLAMTGTVAHVEGRTAVANRSYGYSHTDSAGWTRTDQSPTSAVLGDGGVYSSIDDLSRWAEVVERRRSLLPDSIQDLAFREVRLTDGSGSGYGLGWFIDSLAGRPRYSHGGSTIGFRNAIQRYPEADLTLIFLSNRNEGGMEVVDEIARAALERWR